MAREKGGARVERRLRLGKGALSSSPFPQVLRPHLTELQEVHKEEVRGGSRSQDTVTVPALDPALRAAPGPKPFHPQKRERPSH